MNREELYAERHLMVNLAVELEDKALRAQSESDRNRAEADKAIADYQIVLRRIRAIDDEFARTASDLPRTSVREGSD